MGAGIREAHGRGVCVMRCLDGGVQVDAMMMSMLACAFR